MFSCQDREESERWLRGLGLFSISDRLSQAFDGELESAGISLIIVGQDRKFRIGLNGVEKAAEMDRGSEVVMIKSSGLSKDQDKIFKSSCDAKGD